jgi:membrane fusion protein (multidrug efflux system)
MGKVHEGQDISFRTEGNAKSYAARIAATESEVSENSRSLMIRADILEGDRELTPGSFVNVHISLNSDSAALMIPSEAILPQPRGKKAALLKEGIVSFVTVETGLRDISRIQVMSGISAGDTIILTGLMGLKPDSKVRIQKIRE